MASTGWRLRLLQGFQFSRDGLPYGYRLNLAQGHSALELEEGGSD